MLYTHELLVIAGFFTGGALAIRGGYKAARNSAIMCAVFLAVIEGVGIGFQRMMADNTKLEVRFIFVWIHSLPAFSFFMIGVPETDSWRSNLASTSAFNRKGNCLTYLLYLLSSTLSLLDSSYASSVQYCIISTLSFLRCSVRVINLKRHGEMFYVLLRDLLVFLFHSR